MGEVKHSKRHRRQGKARQGVQHKIDKQAHFFMQASMVFPLLLFFSPASVGKKAHEQASRRFWGHGNQWFWPVVWVALPNLVRSLFPCSCLFFFSTVSELMSG